MKRVDLPHALDLKHLRLEEVLDFTPAEGIIRLHEQRVVILSAAAMGLLKKELIDTLGTDTARRLMLRFGFADGYHDAISLRDRSHWQSPVDGLHAGAVLHRLEGIARVETTNVQFDEATGRFEAQVAWHNSYAAEQHVHHFGKSTAPVCWSLAGYASGYTSACFGREIYYRETACLGQGAPYCSVVGRDAVAWGDELAELRADFQSGDLEREVEKLREMVHQRMKDLDRREQVVVSRERELNLLRERVAEAAARKHFVAGSESMQQVLEFAARVAPLDTTVLVQGESGTGKEFIVGLIHDQSARAGGPFVSVNCAALTETLLESELFGHVRGAFTGAVRDKPGLFEVAHNGTLFLDEVGEVAPTVQAKLLRALQENEIRRVGGERTIKVNARVIAATNRDLRREVQEGRFRRDLYERLNFVPLRIPPLRERRYDIPVLLRHALDQLEEGRWIELSADAERYLMELDFAWPGNVRHLEQLAARLALTSPNEPVSAAELEGLLEPGGLDAAPLGDFESGLPEYLERAERQWLEEALRRYADVPKKELARKLNIGESTLHKKIKLYRLDPD